MGKFKLICCKCGSDKILEKTNKSKLACKGTLAIFGEGIQRKCLDCDNEDFAVFKTWEE